MSTINTTKNEYGESITITNPNTTIQNIKNVEGQIDADNVKLQGLEVRNFEIETASVNLDTSRYKVWSNSVTNIATNSWLGWFNNQYRYIGPFDTTNTSVLLECSFDFQVTYSSNIATNLTNRPLVNFRLGWANNNQGQNVSFVEGTLRQYQSNRTMMRRVAGACSIVSAFNRSYNPIYFYVLIYDTNYPESQTLGQTDLKISNMTFMGREYQR